MRIKHPKPQIIMIKKVLKKMKSLKNKIKMKIKNYKI